MDTIGQFVQGAAKTFQEYAAPAAKELHKLVNPEYEKMKGTMAREADKYKMFAAAALAATLFFAVFGMLLCVTGSPIIGISLELITLPLAYITYNAYKLCDNLKKIALNLEDYSDLTIEGYVPNRDKCKHAALDGTIGLDWFANQLLGR